MTAAIVVLGVVALAAIALNGVLLWVLLTRSSQNFVEGIKTLSSTNADLTETLVLGRDSPQPNERPSTPVNGNSISTELDVTWDDIVTNPALLDPYEREMLEPPDLTHLLTPPPGLEQVPSELP